MLKPRERTAGVLCVVCACAVDAVAVVLHRLPSAPPRVRSTLPHAPAPAPGWGRGGGL